MGKFKSWKYKSLFMDVATSTCLVGATAGLVFGVSAGTFTVNYMDLDNGEARLNAYNSSFEYYSQDIGSEWNMAAKLDEHEQDISKEHWEAMHNGAQMLNVKNKDTGEKYNLGSGELTEEQIRNRYEYMAMVIDGSTHSTMDRSFNQGLYNGIVDFIKNKDIASTDLDAETNNDPVKFKCAHSFKPGADNTTEFLNIYAAVSKTFRTIGLAGFNHVSYLEAMGERNKDTGLFEFTNPDSWKTAYLLIDGDIANNQNVASVLFRADQPGWMVGIATSMYFLKNLHLYHDSYQDLAIGAYGGTAIPTVMTYMGGVQRGVEFFNKLILKDRILDQEMNVYLRIVTDEQREAFAKAYDIDFIESLIEHSKHKDEINSIIAEVKAGGEKSQQIVDMCNQLYEEYKVRMIKLGAPGTHFSGTFAAGDAIGITKQYLNRGAGAIIAVAGPQSLDSAQEVRNQHSKSIVIGVDTAMEEGDYQRAQSSADYADTNKAADGSTPAQANNIIKFSAIKDIKNVTKKFADLCAENKNFNVEAQHLWEHVTYPTHVSLSTATEEEKGEIEKQVIPNEAFIIEEGTIEKVGTGKILKGINPDFKLDRKQYTICRIPEEVSAIDVEAFADAFGPTDTGASFPNVTRIVFNNFKRLVLRTDAFKGCSNITTLDFSNNENVILGKSLDPISNLLSNDSKVNDEEDSILYVYQNSLAGISANNTKENAGEIYLSQLAPWKYEEETIHGEGGDQRDSITNLISEKSGLSPLDSQGKRKWYKINPDVRKSICNIGYKTCGNVENGLISISWDGWVPFMQAMQHLKPVIENSQVNKSNEDSRFAEFTNAWKIAVKGYEKDCTEAALREEIGQDYDQWKSDMQDIDKLITYKTDSLIKKYYPHVMGVLGWFMKNVYFNMDRSMTILIDQNAQAYLPEEGQEVEISILDWLRLNMYFNA